MLKRMVVLGDPTTTGGSVLNASDTRICLGKGMAVVGSSVYCPKCDTVGKIVEGAPTFIIDGKSAVYDGCAVACGCKPFGCNRVIASHCTMMMEVKDRNEKPKSTIVNSNQTATNSASTYQSTYAKQQDDTVDKKYLIRQDAKRLLQCADELCDKHLYHDDIKQSFKTEVKQFADDIIYQVDTGNISYTEGAEAIKEEEKSLWEQSSEWLIRGLTIFGGVGLITAGVAMCTTGVGCVIGAYLGAHGANSIQEGITGNDGYLRSAYQNVAEWAGGEKEYGDLVYNSVDLLFSGYGLLKSVPKIDKFTNTAKFKLWHYGKQDLEKAYKQMSKIGLIIEAANDLLTISNIKQNIKNLVLIDKKTNEIAISIKEPENINNVGELVDSCMYVMVVTDDNNPANRDYYECTKPSGEVYKIYADNDYEE
ncbi:PAAR domain-containing protein [Orbaceae bacterium ESL0721]|nr:PAAR domain-containing protein [Orbaceae bacterium ESL0721]